MDASRNGFILGGLMAAPFGFLTMLVGIAALQQMPGLANPEEAFARSMMSAMPAGLRALMMSAILAAVVTSGESSVNSATALFVNDVAKRVVPDRSDRFYLRLSQVSCAVLGLFALALALNAPKIVDYIRLGFMIRTPVAIAVLMGLCTGSAPTPPVRRRPSSSARWPCSAGRISATRVPSTPSGSPRR